MLSVGLEGWVNFERACKRTELLSEAYLSLPIAQILNSHTGKRVVSEFRHPILAPLSSTSGRRPTTDFVVCDHDDAIAVAIESKWVGRSSPTPKMILWDLMRLELIRREFDAECFFIMAGTKKKLEALSNKAGFKDKKSKGRGRPLLRLDANALNRVRLDSTDVFRRKILREIYSKYQEVEFPTALATRRASPLMTEAKNRAYQVYVWRLIDTTASLAKPTNSIHFHINPADRKKA